jgi:hypothetical protein
MDKPALISLTFDDGLRCQFERAIPILNQHGFPATFFLIANQDSTHDRWAGHTKDWWEIDWREDDIEMLKQLAYSSGWTSVPDVLAGVVQKGSCTYETPQPTQTPSGSQIPAERCFLMGHAR